MKTPSWYDVWQEKQMRLTGRKTKLKGKWLLIAASTAFGGILAAWIIMLIVFAYFAKDLPSPDNVVRTQGYSSKIFDRNGKLLYDVFNGERQTPVKIAEVPKYLKEATVSIEDKNFYTNAGVDPLTPLRILYNLVLKQRVIGGSTLTQQLVKNTLLTNERTIPRKIKEFILTLQVDSKYTKDQVLEMYLNEVPYGGTAKGVGEAADLYFGKKISDINLAESAILAGLPQSPTQYSPYSGKLYVDRAKEVLRRMREDGYINSQLEKDTDASLMTVPISTSSGDLQAPHFVFYVKQELAAKYGEQVLEQGGLRVTTTLDVDLQNQVQQIVKEEIDKVKNYKISNGAAIVEDVKTGQILAMVGSKDWNDPKDGKFNVVTALRQPGSSIKPVVYLTALRKGYTASTMLMDVQTTFPGGDKPEYVPVDYDGKWRGPVLVRDALGNSLNIPAVKMVAMVGIKDMMNIAYDMGFSSLNPTPELLSRVGLSIALGGGEVSLLDEATSYSAFGNGGYKVDPVSILKVTDVNGKVLEEWKPSTGKQVMSPGEAFIISDMLSDNNARTITFGVKNMFVIPGHTVAVKTGTTNDKKDNWTIGWTPSFIAGVWVGNNDGTPMTNVASGVTGASPIWRRIILETLKNQPEEKFVQPDSVVQIAVDKISGYRAHDGFDSKQEYFIKGTEPWADDPTHVKLKVCKGEGKLATPADISSGNYDEKEYIALKEEDPLLAQDKTNKWQEGVVNWLATQADPKYHPPTDYCGSTNPLWIRITDPSDRSRINGSDLHIRAEVDDTSNVNKVEFFVDGVAKYTAGSAPAEVTIPNVGDGYHRIDIRATDDKGNVGTRYVQVSVNQDYADPTPTPNP
jgi:penicillin-binding protein 1C